MAQKIELAFLPSEALRIEADCYVVVDALRATTTIATLFTRGLADLVVLDDLAAAREAARREGRLLFGEVDGLPPEGFDYGNSPVEAAGLDLERRRAVLFTTNGTLALCALAARGTVYAGAIANAGAIAQAIDQHQRAVVVCAGTDGATRFALEDFAAAGRIIARSIEREPGTQLGNAAALALRVVEVEGPAALFSGSEHAEYLKRNGLAADVEFALREDTSGAAPVVSGWGEGWAVLEAGA